MDYAAEYTRLHQDYPKLFAGMTLKRYVGDLEKITREHKPANILDYASGKGYSYLKARYHDRFDPCPHCGRGLLPILYDIGVRQLSERPTIKFDGVINSDMMEHIERADVPRILDDILGFLRPTPMHVLDDKFGAPFVFFGICCVPEKNDVKKLSDGRGVHVTLEPPQWWRRQIVDAVDRLKRPVAPTIYCVFETEGATVREVIE